MKIRLNDEVLVVGRVDKIFEDGTKDGIRTFVRLWLPNARETIIVRLEGIHSMLKPAVPPKQFRFGQRVQHTDGRVGIVIRLMPGDPEDVEIAYQDEYGYGQTEEVYSGDLTLYNEEDTTDPGAS